MFFGPPTWVVELIDLLKDIRKGIAEIMALVQVDQAALDSLAASLEAVKTSLAAEIASLQVQLPAANLAGLNQALADLQGLEPPTPPAS